MITRKIFISKEKYLTIKKMFKNNLVVFSTCTYFDGIPDSPDDCIVSTSYSFTKYSDIPFIGYEKKWNKHNKDKTNNIKFFIYLNY